MAKKTISNTFTVNTVEDGDDSVVYKIDFGNSVFSYDPNTNRNTIFINGTVYKVVGNDTLVFTELTSSMLSLAFYDANGALVRNVSSADIGVENGTFITRSGNASAPSSPNPEESLLATITIDGVQVARNGLQIFKDGKSAPFYSEEWYAWSNDTSTASVTTSPSIDGSWQTYIPAQGGIAYLWKKIIRWNYNTSTKEYIDSSPQYFRMSGTNGTSISTKGSVDYQTSQQATQHGGGTSLDDITNPSDGDAYVVGLDLKENEGWLYQWTTESGSWIPLGQFKGESGATYYTHIVWATNIISSSMGISRIDGYVAAKDPDDTTHFWMGTYVDETPTDPTSGTDDILKQYSWTNTKGEAKLYSIQANKESAKIASNQTSLNTNVSFSFYTKTGDATREDFDTYFTIYTVADNGVHQRVNPVSSTPVRGTSVNQNFNLTTGIRSIAIFIWGTNLSSAYVGSYPNTQPYLAKKEIPVLKDGDDGAQGELGKIGRFPYYAGVWEEASASKQFAVTDAQAPYFEYTLNGQKRYAVFDPEDNDAYYKDEMLPQVLDTSDNEMKPDVNTAGSPWRTMTNDFDYLITKAVFGLFAQFGSFLINGEWLYSQEGTWRGDLDGHTSTVDYYLFSWNGASGSKNYITGEAMNTHLSPEDPAEEYIDEIADETNRQDNTIYYPYPSGDVYLEAGVLYSLRIRAVKSDIYICDANDVAVKLGDITILESEFYGAGFWYFQVKTSGTYSVKVVRNQSGGTSITVDWIYLSAEFFVPNVAFNGRTGYSVMNKTTGNITGARGIFENLSGKYVSLGGNGGSLTLRPNMQINWGESTKYLKADNNGYLYLSDTQ